MSDLSKDQKAKNAIKDINAMESVEAVKAYIAGDDRQDVLDAAQVQIDFILKASETTEETMKQGQVETITSSTDQTPEPLPDVKMITKEAKASVITIRDGKAVTVRFDEKGKEIE